MRVGARAGSIATWQGHLPTEVPSIPSFAPFKYEKNIPLLCCKCFAGSVFRRVAGWQ